MLLRQSWIYWTGMISSVVLPFFNIPLMMRMVRRKSSEDLSLVWVVGVFFCIVGMVPAALRSSDVIFKVFEIVNLIFFSGVTFLTIRYRIKSPSRL